ncbi:SurA N-terminal domain containing protein [Candidatus Nanopelagicaceae bacterium]
MKKILALLGVISVLALTGCGKVDSAATIGDITISQASAQATVDEVLAERAKIDSSQMQIQSGNALNRSQLRFTIVTTLFDEIAKELKLTISSTELAKTKSDLIAQSGGAEALATNLVAAQIAPSNFDRYVRAIITSNKIQEALAASGVPADEVSSRVTQLVNAKAAELKVKVNPRYGTWDQDTGDIVATDSAGSAVVPSGN